MFYVGKYNSTNIIQQASPLSRLCKHQLHLLNRQLLIISRPLRLQFVNLGSVCFWELL